MHVLVTGHTGFKGAWLTVMLRELGHTVSGLALDPAAGALYERAGLADLLEHDLRVDIRDAAATAAAVAAVSPDAVMHLAAQPLVRESYRDPRTTWETNTMGTFNVLEAVRATPSVRAALIITTDKVYRNDDQIWGYRETDPLGGVDPYSASKAAADLLTQSWIASSGATIPVGIARAGNVIGGGDVCAERLLVDIVHAFTVGEPVRLRYPAAVRPWQHVLDCIYGYVTLLDALLDGTVPTGEAFNIAPGTGSFVQVGEVATLAARLWGPDAVVELDTSAHPHEANMLALDARKAEVTLGWHNHVDFATAMELTLGWARQVNDGAAPREITTEQVRAFLAQAVGSAS